MVKNQTLTNAQIMQNKNTINAAAAWVLPAGHPISWGAISSERWPGPVPSNDGFNSRILLIP